MKTVEVASLIPGSIAEYDYYSDTGELLLSKGVVISKSTLDILSRRNIFSVATFDNETEKTMSRFASIDVDKQHASPSDKGSTSRDTAVADGLVPETPPASELTGLTDILDGETGLNQLQSGQKPEAGEKEVARNLVSDKPVGVPLSAKARHMKVSERTQDYKNSIVTDYQTALERSRNLFEAIIQCKAPDGFHIKRLVQSFIKTYIMDKNILLNISSIKHQGDDYIYNHALNVCLLSINIAAAAGYNEEQVLEIGMGGLLHDVGMMMIPGDIRLKKDKLTTNEWYEVRKHPALALHALEKIPYLPRTVPYVAYQSHERENGKGYPKQLVGRRIHCYTKIVQLADIYESMSSPRSYRSAFLPYKAMEALIKQAHGGFLNIDFVKYFLAYMSLFPVGSMVELNDQRIAKVVQANGNLFAKPVVSVLADKGGPFIDKTKIYQEDLKSRQTVQIVHAVPGDIIPGVGLMDGF